MTEPLIGITTHGRDQQGRFSLAAAYVDAVRRAGGAPLLLPPGEPRLHVCASVLHGLILSGGGDVHPDAFGGRDHPSARRIDVERDRDEIELCRFAVEEGLPTLGVCRGPQVLNVALGGTLIEHLPDVVGEVVAHRTAERKPVAHPVQITAGSLTARVMQTTSSSPLSWHHQAVGVLAAGISVVARAADGVVEGIELPGHPWLIAVQWHPELTASEDPCQQRLFDALVAAARARA